MVIHTGFRQGKVFSVFLKFALKERWKAYHTEIQNQLPNQKERKKKKSSARKRPPRMSSLSTVTWGGAVQLSKFQVSFGCPNPFILATMMIPEFYQFEMLAQWCGNLKQFDYSEDLGMHTHMHTHPPTHTRTPSPKTHTHTHPCSDLLIFFDFDCWD